MALRNDVVMRKHYCFGETRRTGGKVEKCAYLLIRLVLGYAMWRRRITPLSHFHQILYVLETRVLTFK
jgi:hypothetical protein